eukprot:scaffold97074_cov28-Tisochrysis_lutea.AAC.6
MAAHGHRATHMRKLKGLLRARAAHPSLLATCARAIISVGGSNSRTLTLLHHAACCTRFPLTSPCQGQLLFCPMMMLPGMPSDSSLPGSAAAHAEGYRVKS